MSRPGASLAALAVAAFGIAALAVFLGAHHLVVLRGWLVAAHIFLALASGAAVLLLTHAITGGRWGEALDPVLRAAAGTMPLAALAFVPLILAADELFPWAGVPPGELPEIVAKKLAYLDIGLLRLRTVVVLALFVGVAWAAGAWSRRPPSLALASAALMVFGIAVTVFTVDWLMAFEPSFYSTIYAVLHASGAVVAAFALGTLWLWAVGGETERLSDCGMLMLGWAMVWLYMTFMQYLVIWSGDIPIEIHWYLVRIGDGWRLVLWVAIATHTGAIAAMSSPALKKRPQAVAVAAGALLVGQMADFWWRTAPVFERDGMLPGALDVAATAALGGLWLAAVLATGSTARRGEARNG